MAKYYVIELLAEERAELEALVRRGKASAQKITRARVLLLSDQGQAGPGWIDADIAEALVRIIHHVSRLGWSVAV